MPVWLVLGYDVGGNTGSTVQGVFTSETAAKRWAEESPARYMNNAFSEWRGAAFEVEEYDLWDSFDEALAVVTDQT